MAIRYNIEKHATAYPSKVLASSGGAHIFNITLTLSDIDNGNFVGKGNWIELDRYEQAAPTSFSGIAREQAPNGEWYVEVVSTENAYFVYQVPMIEEQYNNAFQIESNFFNLKGDTVRAYELKPGDIIAVSEEGFETVPTAGATLKLTGNKLDV